MTDTPTGRRRAPGMSPDRRRDMIVQTALPLIAQHGAAVTTAQIARAAGIGEATVFRVFADKDAVLQACIATVLDPTVALDDLGAIDLTRPLADRLLEAADALDAYLDRMGTVLGGLHASGAPNRRPPVPTDGAARRDDAQAATREAVAALFEPDGDRLRLPADVLADAYLRLLFGRTAGPGRPAAKPDRRQLIDLLLNGAFRESR
ncbi:TetR/AcrR family transcriptional regulator [Actinoplanes flavus]|uniref:TetR/AcrR family transcriptional regulator n=1 Tax=Actinoplanes flavus TaxID=2820290 RepID=A0ABS3UWQ7_9ACTN|nr:TetR/AcrR family transcriptional regulator [Actinoplanes flavus]MBO3743008.1 TetR/AcrR family transcriptional regulator [Actinoplanes flavus]